MADKAACEPLPSTKYPELELPRSLLLQHAREQQAAAQRSSSCPADEPRRLPAKNTGGLTGPGRAGKVGSLLGASGCRYVGQVLAGRPHGRGSCYVASDAPGQRERLAFDGDWVKGVRQGRGVCHFGNGEVYDGDWWHNRRHGSGAQRHAITQVAMRHARNLTLSRARLCIACNAGKLTYADGSAYEGAWAADKRHSTGSFSSARGGSIFVGSFVQDRRQGLGVAYFPARGETK